MKWGFQVLHLQFSYHEAYASLWQISCQNWKATLEKMNELSLWKWAHYHVYYQFSPHSYISVRWNGTVQTDFSPLSPSAFLNLPHKNSVSLVFTHAELQWLTRVISAEFHFLLAGREVLLYWKNQNGPIMEELRYLWYVFLGLTSFTVSCPVPRGRLSPKQARGFSGVPTCS